MNQLNRDKVNASFVERNREHIKVVLDVVMFCAKQDIPLRRHTDTDANKGNFLELFHMLSKYNPEIESRLDQLPKNANVKLRHTNQTTQISCFPSSTEDKKGFACYTQHLLRHHGR